MKPNSTRRPRWTLVLVAGLVLAAMFTLRAGPVISEADARKQLEQGALVVDVRTAGEFRDGHLTNALNLPLDELKTALPQQVTNRSQPLLLYCRSGRRSGIAEKELRALGYTNAFNLGSFGRAKGIVEGKR